MPASAQIEQCYALAVGDPIDNGQEHPTWIANAVYI
jgi:hypothetical protein